MTTLVFAYGLAWSAIALYFGRVTFHGRRLARRIEHLDSLKQDVDTDRTARRAA